MNFYKISIKSIKKRDKENFPVASLLLPRKIRGAMIDFYNFARHADDIADHTTAKPEERLKTLMEINNAFVDGNEMAMPEWGIPYLRLTKEGRCDARHGKRLLSAFIQDVTKHRYESWNDLIDYCMRSAAPVGRTILELHEEWGANIKASDTLCAALQILNHLQDMKEDFLLLDRVYLPETWFGNIAEIGENQETPTVRETINRTLDKVDVMLEEASILPEHISSIRLRGEIATIIAIANLLSKKLRKNDPIAENIKLSFFDRLMCLLKGTLAALLKGKKLEAPFKKEFSYHSSFFWPLIRLPKEKRKAMFKLYEFCRAVDDAVDESENTREAKDNLNFWENEIKALYNNSSKHQDGVYPSNKITRALLPYIHKFNLKEGLFEEIIKGQKMDSKGIMIRPSLETLESYCYRVASCVGLLSIEIFGYESNRTKDFAIYLGKAMQLINILRDIEEDAKKGRIYLPKAILEREGLGNISPEELIGHNNPALRNVLSEVGNMAKIYLHKTEGLLSERDRKNMKPALLMRQIYSNYLRMLEENIWNGKEVSMGFIDKFRAIILSP